jgi:cysteine desulfurase family protein (TIGR01976 family)
LGSARLAFAMCVVLTGSCAEESEPDAWTTAQAESITEIRGMPIRVRSCRVLERRLPDGTPVAFLDGAGGSQLPDTVIEAVARHLRTSVANIHGVFPTARETDATIAKARSAAADFTGARADEIAFGPNMTTLNFLLARAVARVLNPDDEIVVTALDHDANIAPWRLVGADRGLVARSAPLQPADATLDLEALEELIGPRTRVVAFPLASNAVGSIPDARRICEVAHAVGALAWVDAVHYAPHRRLDFAALSADVLLFSPYKCFGPDLGVAAIRRQLAESLPAERVRPARQTPPGHRFETGTQSHEALAGLVAAVDYLAELGSGEDRRSRLDSAFRRIQRHETELTLRFLRHISAMPVTLYGIAEPARVDQRTATFCLRVDGITPQELSEALADDGVFSWHGNFYALELMKGLGLEERGGGVRVGFLHYNTAEEVDRCADALDRAAGRALRRRGEGGG